MQSCAWWGKSALCIALFINEEIKMNVEHVTLHAIKEFVAYLMTLKIYTNAEIKERIDHMINLPNHQEIDQTNPVRDLFKMLKPLGMIEFEIKSKETEKEEQADEADAADETAEPTE
jgi:hypothetical protein